MKTASSFYLKVGVLITLLFAFDVAFDSVLTAGRVDLQYVLHDAWAHTGAVVIAAYFVFLTTIAIGSLRIFHSRPTATAQVGFGAALAIAVTAIFRYSLHTFSTIT